jgi:hypothetical protein
MTQADRVLSTPPTNTPTSTTRRGFLSQGAGAAAGGAVLALATSSPASTAVASATAADPVFSVIAAHTKIAERVLLAAAELDRHAPSSEDDWDKFGDLTSAEMNLLLEMPEVVPTTLAGVVALVVHLNQIYEKDPWKFEDNYATPLIGTLAKAFSRIGVAS